jgi:hypothetical protein
MVHTSTVARKIREPRQLVESFRGRKGTALLCFLSFELFVKFLSREVLLYSNISS